MQGTVYKELRQHTLLWLGALLLPLVGNLFSLLVFYESLDMTEIHAGSSPDDNFGTGFSLTKLLITVLIFLAIRVVSASVFSDDESKRWGYFISAVPHGRERGIYGKYVFIFMLWGMLFVSSIFCDSFSCMIFRAAFGKASPPLAGMLCILFFVEILFAAFEIPFNARFGTKISAAVRSILLLAIVIAFMIWLLFSSSALSVFERVSEMLEDLINGKVNGGIKIAIALIPWAAVISYPISYKISCKVYLKGVANYEK